MGKKLDIKDRVKAKGVSMTSFIDTVHGKLPKESKATKESIKVLLYNWHKELPTAFTLIDIVSKELEVKIDEIIH